MVIAQYADGHRPVSQENDNRWPIIIRRWRNSESGCTWKNEVCTIFAHNFRAYAGHFVLIHVPDNHLKAIKVIE